MARRSGIRSTAAVILSGVILALPAGCDRGGVDRRVETLIASKDLENANVLVNEEIKKSPERSDLRALKVKVLCRMGRTRDAFEELDRYLTRERAPEPWMAEELVLSPLRGSDAAFKFVALADLAEMPKLSDAAAELVTGMLRDPDKSVRAAACWTIGRRKLAKAEDALIAAIGEGKDPEIWNAIWALGEIRSGKAVPKLMELVAMSQIPTAKTESVLALAKIGTPQSAAFLKERRTADGKTLPLALRAASEHASGGGIDDTWAFVESQKDPMLTAFLVLITGELDMMKLAPKVAALLSSDDPSIRANVLRCLGELEAAKFSEEVRPFTRVAEAAERTQAYYAFLRFGSKDTDLFARGLDDISPEVRRLSALGYGSAGPRKLRNELPDRLAKASIQDKLNLMSAVMRGM